MDTKEAGADAPKPGDVPPEPPKAADAKATEVLEAAKPVDASEPAQEDRSAATEKAPITADATRVGGDEPKADATDAPKSKPPIAAEPERKASSSGTIAGVVALVILIGGVLGAIFIARRGDTSSNAPPAKHQKGKGNGKKDPGPPWKVGMKVPVVITVLPEDKENLECISKDEVAGKHCAFEAKDTPWSKGDAADDKLLLRPYATTGKRRLIAAGFWSQLKDPMPEKRFSSKCTFVIEGKLEKPWVRFRKTMEFKEVHEGWFAGALTDCQPIPAPGAPAGSASAAAPK